MIASLLKREMHYRLNLIGLLLTSLVLVLGACAALVPREHLIPMNQLASKLQEKVPLHLEKPAGVPGLTLGLTITNPKLSLITSESRVVVESDFIANAGKLSLGGRFAVSGQLRYGSEDRTVLVKEARLDILQFKNGKDVPEWARSRIEPMVVQSIEKNPLYRFSPGELVALGVELDVEAIEVVRDGILCRSSDLI